MNAVLPATTTTAWITNQYAMYFQTNRPLNIIRAELAPRSDSIFKD